MEVPHQPTLCGGSYQVWNKGTTFDTFVHRLHIAHYYFSSFHQEQQRCCLALLDLLPTVECIAPTEVLETMASGSGGKYRATDNPV